MVYDGYYGGFVSVEAASFDVSLTPEAVVLLPLDVLEDQRAGAEAEARRRRAADARRARPRCDTWTESQGEERDLAFGLSA
jgi:hypothetical protein